MDERTGGAGRKLLGLMSGISRLPSFLLGLFIILVIAGGGYAAWQRLHTTRRTKRKKDNFLIESGIPIPIL